MTHIIEIEQPIEELLDKCAGNWDNDVARKTYDLAILCTASKSQRPFMNGQMGVFESLKNIQSKIVVK